MSRPGHAAGSALSSVWLSLLDAVELRGGTGTVHLGGRVQRAILARLALDRGRAVPTDVLIEDVWGPIAGDRTHRSLATLVSRIRRSLEPFPWGVTFSAGAYRLDAPDGATDWEVFRTRMAIARAAGVPGRAADLAADALALWGPLPLAGLDAPFVPAARERMIEERLHGEDEFSEWLLAAGQVDRAIAALRAHVESTPFREPRWVRLIEALHRSGRPHEALTTHRRAVTMLRDRLGLEPSPALARMEYEVLDRVEVTPAATDGPNRSVPFVGREVEFGTVADAVFAARRNASVAAVLLRGESGIGKTRIVDEAARCLAGAATVLRGACAPGSVAPVGALIEPLVDALTADDRERLGASAQELTRLLDPAEAPSDAAMLEVRVARATSAAYAHLAERGHVVVIVDDIQWSDAMTRRIVRDALLGTYVRGLSVVMVERVGADTTDHRRWLDALMREVPVRSVDIGPLSNEASDAIVGWVLTDPGAWSDEIFRASRGNPLLTIELAALVSERGDAWQGPLPNRTQRLLATRSADLPPDARSLLETGALIGAEFALDDVAAVLGLTGREAIAGIDAAVDAGLLEPAGDDRWRFAHALWREYFDGLIGDERRRSVHARIARLFLDRGDDPIAAALHVEAAGTAIDRSRRRAALAGGGRAAVGEARLELAQRLLEAAQGVAGDDVEASIEIAIALGEVHLALGDVARGSAMLEAAWDEARAVGAWGQAAEVALAFSRVGLTPTPGRGAARAEQATVAFEQLGDADPFRRGLLATYLYNLLSFSDERRALEFLAEAERMMHCEPSLVPYVEVCLLRREVEVGPDSAAIQARCERFVGEFGSSNPHAGAIAATLEIVATVRSGQEVAPAAVQHVIDEGRMIGRADVQHYGFAIDALLAIARESATAARRAVLSAQEFGTAAGLPAAGHVGLLQLATVLRETLGLGEIRPLLDAASGSNFLVLELLLADAQAVAGDRSESRSTCESVLERIGTVPAWARAGTAALAVDVITSVAPDLLADHGTELARILDPFSDQMIVFAMVGLHLGPADRALAAIAVAQGALDDALARVRLADAVATRSGSVLWQGWCAADQAAIHAEIGDAGSSEAARRRAERVARAYGSHRLARSLASPEVR